MRAPRFWFRPPGVFSTLLAPLGALYAVGTARRLSRGARLRVGVPVICVGNLNAGGTGKTPVVADLLGRVPGAHVVSKGYGGRLSGPVRVDGARHSAEDVGDEPLLLSAFGPVFVAEDRAAGAAAAIDAGATAILLDDGFQNARLHHDLSIVVVDAFRGFGNGAVLPAGPLREPVETGLGRADLLMVVGPEVARRRFLSDWASRIACPLLEAELRPLQTGLPLRGAPVLAFAGIGNPDKFFATLESLGANILKRVPLGDHQTLTPGLMARMEADAMRLGAMMVTTEKDAVRLPQAFRQKVSTVPVRLEIEDDAALSAALAALPVEPGN